MPTLVVRSVWRCGSRTGAFFARRPIVERKKRLFVCVGVCVCVWLAFSKFFQESSCSLEANKVSTVVY